MIKVNGIYYGKIDNTVKFINGVNSSSFIEICPVNLVNSQVGFFLTEETLSSPPPFISVTDICGGYLIKYLIDNIKKDFSVIEQKRFNNALITLFTENGYKLSIESAGDFFTENLNFPFENANHIFLSADCHSTYQMIQ